MNLGKAIKEVREARKMSIEALSQATQISTTELSSIESSPAKPERNN